MRGPLRPAELAEAAVLADLAVLVLLVARLTPLAPLGPAVAAVAFAVLSHRHRLRVVAVAGVAAGVLTFLLVGFATAQTVVVAALWGGVAGRAARDGWGPWRSVAVSVVVGWTTVATATLAFLSIFVGTRELAFENVRVQWTGVARILDRLALGEVAALGTDVVEWSIRWWFVTVPLFQLVISVALAVLVRRVVAGPVARVAAALPVPEIEPVPDDGPVGPVPTTMDGVTVVRGGRRVLDDVDLRIEPGRVLLVRGPNGAGKSTLLDVLAGLVPADAGVVRRPGSAGLGRPGGTAWIGQRPETQVVGARVADDLRTGLDPADDVDHDAVERALSVVGLAGWAEADTADRSGGQLQRIAIAAALVREPALLISDESTAMLDPTGRAEVRAALRAAADAGAAVVHVSHLEEDVAIADDIAEVVDGRLRLVGRTP